MTPAELHSHLTGAMADYTKHTGMQATVLTCPPRYYALALAAAPAGVQVQMGVACPPDGFVLTAGPFEGGQ